MIHAVAKELLGHCPQGQTLPLYLLTGSGITFQCKLPGKRSGMGPREMATEVLGTRLSSLFGLSVGIPAVVGLPPAVRDAVEDRYGFGLTGQTAFGTVFITDLEPFLPAVDVADVDHDTAARVLALDLLLANGDRTPANPNLGWLGDDLFVFDFEHGLTLPSRRPFESHCGVLPVLKDDHVFRDRVTSDALRRTLSRLFGRLESRPGWESTDRLPPEWRFPYAAAVEHVRSILNVRDDFVARAVE